MFIKTFFNRKRTSVTSQPSNTGQFNLDYLSRTTGPQLLVNYQFNTSGEIDSIRFPDANQANVVHETSTKLSGNGSLKINIPASAGQGTGSANLSNGGTTRGNGSRTFYQFSQYTPDALLRNKPAYSAGNGGWKSIIISSWSNDFSLGSFTENEVVVNNQDWRGFPLGYQHNGSGFVNFDAEVNTPCEAFNYRYTTGIDAGTPTSPSTCSEYEQRYGVLWHNPAMPNLGIPSQESDVIAAGFPSPHALTSGAVPWTKDGWTTIEIEVKIGTLGTASSEIRVWAAKTGRRPELMHEKLNITLGTENGGHLGFWLTPFDTARVSNSAGVVSTYVCYAEAIVSDEFIPFPAVHEFTPPYTLPSSGQVVAIGTNTAYSIVPSGMNTSQWSYALFNNFGGGALIRDYSVAGAWGIIGGGHGVPHQTGAALFDFTDATWKRRDPSNTTSAYGPDDFAEADTTGTPHWYVTGTTVPAPAHGWQTICEMPKWMGGGPKGSLIYVQRTAICNESRYSQYSYRFDLNTGDWSVLSANTNTRNEHEGAAVLDETRRRWWLLAPNQNAFNDHKYLDGDDLQWKTTAAYTGSGAPTGCAEGSLFQYGSLLLRQGQTGNLYAWDCDDGTANWAQLTVSGTLPSNEHNVFAFFPPHNAFYAIGQAGGASLNRLRPPTGATTIAALLSGTWTCDTVTVSPSLPSRTADGGGPVSHYNSLFFVPSIQRLAWVPGGNESVYLIYPPTP